MSKPSAGGLVGRLPRATPSSCASQTSATSSSSVVVLSQVADDFTLPAASSTLTPPDHDIASDACSCSSAPEGGGRSGEFELAVPAATARRAAFWGYVRAAVLVATLAVVVAADVALAINLFPRRGTA